MVGFTSSAVCRGSLSIYLEQKKTIPFSVKCDSRTMRFGHGLPVCERAPPRGHHSVIRQNSGES